VEFHDGLDFSAPYGAPVYATGSGVVVQAGWMGVYGLAVVVDHARGYRTLYGHLSRLAVRPGQRVARGGLLGYVGSTGRSTGPHLHYGVYRYGTPVDPRAYLDPTWYTR
jgi:murein DD-endopeptidase MepM/ murein hydrolase activator NlpD